MLQRALLGELLHSHALHVDGGFDILGPTSIAAYLQELVVGVSEEHWSGRSGEMGPHFDRGAWRRA